MVFFVFTIQKFAQLVRRKKIVYNYINIIKKGVFVLKIKFNKDDILIYLMFFALAIGMTFVMGHSLFDSDYYWRIKLGEYIYENKMIPQANIFGYLHEIRFVTYEWLFDFIVHLFNNFLGIIGIKIFVVINLFYTFMILYKICMLNTSSRIFSFIHSMISVLLLSLMHITIKPELMSYNIFLAVLYIVIKNFENILPKYLEVVLLVILLVNVQIGLLFMLLLILTIYTMGKFVEKFLENKSIFEAVFYVNEKLLSIAALALALRISPYPRGTYSYMLANLKNEEFFYQFNLLFSGMTQGLSIMHLIYILFVVSILILSRKKINIADYFLIITLLGLTLFSDRYLVYLILVCPMFTSSYIYQWTMTIVNKTVQFLVGEDLNEEIKNSMNFKRYIPIMFLLSSIFILSTVYEYTNNIVPVKYPIGAMKYIEENNIDVNNDRLLSEYTWSGFLIYNDYKTLVDGRLDLFMKNVNKESDILIEYKESIYDIKDSEFKILEKYKIKYILLSKNNPVNLIFRNQPNKFKIIYEDYGTILLEKL